MSRVPVRPTYDALVDTLPWGDLPTRAYALVKKTLVLHPDGAGVTGQVVPLFHDLRDPAVMPRLVPGCEFYPFKRRTDIAVRGSAFAPGGRPVTERKVRVSVGDDVKEVDVVGPRVARIVNGQVAFSAPEPFVQMPMTWRETYGGIDPRVMAPALVDGQAHPGVYPRNPLGKGYVVLDAPVEVELPNLEDPSHRLTAQNLVVGDPTRWWQRPLPWCLEYSLPLMFPRRVWLGAGVGAPLPADAVVPEVQRRFLPYDWRGLTPRPGDEPDPEFYQEASFGLCLGPLGGETPVEVYGMHPSRECVQLQIPRAPQVEIWVDGDSHVVEPRLGTVLIEPAEDRASFIWIALLNDLPKGFATAAPWALPLAVSVDGDLLIPYQPPVGDLRFAEPTPTRLPSVEDLEIPDTRITMGPVTAPRPAASTLRLTDAQLRGEEPVPPKAAPTGAETEPPRLRSAEVDLELDEVTDPHASAFEDPDGPTIQSYTDQED